MKRFVLVIACVIMGLPMIVSGCKNNSENENSNSTTENVETTTDNPFSEEMLSMIKNVPEDSLILGIWDYKGYREYTYTFKNDSTGIYHCINSDKVFTYEYSGDMITFLFQNSKEKLNVRCRFDEDNNLLLKDTFGEESVFVLRK